MEKGRLDQLAAAARDGIPAAVEALWGRLRPVAAAVLLARTPPGCEVEDLLQEAARAYLEALPALRDPARATSWMRSIALHVAADASRREARRRQRLRRLDGSEPSAREVAASAAERARRVLEAARALPSEYREPLLLRAVEGLSQAEVARTLGLTETTVESRLARARRLLRKALERAEEPARPTAAAPHHLRNHALP